MYLTGDASALIGGGVRSELSLCQLLFDDQLLLGVHEKAHQPPHSDEAQVERDHVETVPSRRGDEHRGSDCGRQKTTEHICQRSDHPDRQHQQQRSEVGGDRCRGGEQEDRGGRCPGSTKHRSLERCPDAEDKEKGEWCDGDRDREQRRR